MADTLDSLQIKIQADAKSATNNLDKTADALEKLAKTVDSFNVAKFKNIATSMGTIANAFPKGNRVASSMKNVANSLNSMASVNPLKLTLTANAMKTMSSGASSASKATKNLSKSIKSMPSATSSASKGFTSFASVIGKFYATYFLLIRALGMFRKAIDISSSLTEVENVVNQSFGNMSSKLNEFTKTSMHDFGLSELSAKTFASRYQAMGVAMGFTTEKMSDMSINLTKLVGDMSSFYNVSQEAVAEDLQSIFTGSTRPMRAYGMDLTEATLKSYALSKGMNANIDSMTQMEKTMLRYQYVMEKSGMAQGDFLRTFDTWANRTRYLSQQFQAFGAVVGQILIHVLKPLLRGLNLIMESAINMANTVLNALGQIFGWEYEISGGAVSQIADDSEILADGFDDASKSAKKLKNTLQGFNELNVIGKNDSSSSIGGGATSDGGAGGYNVASKEIDSLFKKYESKITSLEELGTSISKALYKAMNSIDWNKIFEKASNFGKGLADFLNCLISPELFYNVGVTVANSLNTAIYSVLSFGQEFNWSEFGKSLTDSINGFFRTFDFGALAETINAFVQGLRDAILEGLKHLDRKAITQAIGSFIRNIEIDTVYASIELLIIKEIGSVGLKVAKDAIVEKVKEKFAEIMGTFQGMTVFDLGAVIFQCLPTLMFTGGFDMIGAEFVGIIEDVFEAMFPKLSEFIGNFIPGAIGAGIVSAGNPLAIIIGGLASGIFVTFKDSILKLFSFKRAKECFESAFKNFKNIGKSKNILNVGKYIVVGILDGFAGAMYLIFEPIFDFFDSVVDAIKDVFGIHSPAKSMIPIGEYILLGIVEGFRGMFDEFSTTMNDFFNYKVKPWFTLEKWSSIGVGMKDGLISKWNEFKSWFGNTGVVSWWNENVSPWFTWSKWSNLAAGMKDGIASKWNEFKDWFGSTGIVSWWNNSVAPWFTWTKWSNLLSTAMDGAKNGFWSIYNGAVDVFNKLWTRIGDIAKGIGKSVANGVIGGINGMINAVEEGINGFIFVINLMIQNVNKMLKNIAKFTGAKFKGFGLIDGVSFGRIPQFATGGFPEDGLFYANHNELVGQFNNGNTVVANNQQIIQGIQNGVRDAITGAMIPYLSRMVVSLEEIERKEFGISGESVFDSVRKSNRDYYRRTGESAFVY